MGISLDVRLVNRFHESKEEEGRKTREKGILHDTNLSMHNVQRRTSSKLSSTHEAQKYEQIQWQIS